MNILHKLLNQRIERLEADSKKLAQVREWAEGHRHVLDEFGPCITTADGEFMDVPFNLLTDVAIFEDLEEILGTS